MMRRTLCSLTMVFHFLSFLVRSVIVAAVLCCSFVTMLPCVYAEGKEAKEIDVFFFNLSDHFLSSMNLVFKKEARNYGIKINVFDAYGDDYRQKKQLETSFDNGHVKVINLVDPNMAAYCIDNAREQKLRVIFFNRHVNPAVFRDYPLAWFVGTDESTSGPLQAKIIADYLAENPATDKNNDGRINTLLFRGEANSPATLQRSSNCLNSLAGSMIDINLVGDYVANWSRRLAQSYTEALIDKAGTDFIELIISNNDAMGLGAIDALAKHHYNTASYEAGVIPVFGVDSIPEAVQAIKEGRMAGTISNDYEAIAKICVQLSFLDKTDTNSLKKVIRARIEDNGMIYVPYKRVELDN